MPHTTQVCIPVSLSDREADMADYFGLTHHEYAFRKIAQLLDGTMGKHFALVPKGHVNFEMKEMRISDE